MTREDKQKALEAIHGKKCRRCDTELAYLFNDNDDYIVMCPRRECQFAAVYEDGSIYYCSG